MHDRRSEIRGRLRRLVDQHVRPAERRHVADLEVEAWHVPPAADGTVGEPVPFATAKAQEYDAFAVGDPWGPAWATTWFRLTGQVPADLAHAELVVDLGFQGNMAGFQSEGLVHRPDGTHVKALNPLNDWVPVTSGESVELYVEAAANPHVLTGWTPTRLGDKVTSSSDPVYRLVAAAVVEVRPEVRELLADIEVLDQLAAELGEDDARQVEILLALEAALDALDLADVPATASTAREALAAVLARPAYDGAHRVSAVGHAHIDSAWLWPIRETVRKVTRTVANVVNLLDDDPDLVYAMSSAQQWEWVRAEHPELFERVKAHAAAGRFVPVGGMWVESDTNMVGGEAMARQFLVGQRWFEEHLGTTCDEVWLPDSFGYTAALPQIVTQAGCRWFLTQKISWNTTNVFPHHTFWWEGIDGTRVFTHFPPVDTYTAELTGRELAHAARNFRDKGAATRSLVPFGHGDGGGGPTREMLGRASRTSSLAGSPTVSVETPRAFFEAAEARVRRRPGLGGRALPGDPPRHLHVAGRDEAGQPPLRAPAPRGRAVVGDGGGTRPAGLPGRGAGRDLADRAAAPVPRHPPRVLDRVGAPRGAGDVRRGGGASRAHHRGRPRRAGRRRDRRGGVQRGAGGAGGCACPVGGSRDRR